MKTDANIKTASKLALVALLMFGFGYALVPLYNVFCEVAGINGKTGEISLAQAAEQDVDMDRLVTVEFVTSVNSELLWKFKPVQRKLSVHPGEIYEALFLVQNLSNETMLGQAVPSVAPQRASLYFNKTECFCFTQQRLGPGEQKELPVRFIVDPDMPGNINILTLSYTFFKSPGSVAMTPDNKTIHNSTGDS
jgi:cytochrome c oxidase assembly protein subunit 11